jgi:hypothetical protein
MKLSPTANALIDLFLGDIDQLYRLTPELRSILSTLPIFDSELPLDKYASTYFKINLCNLEALSLLENSVLQLHKELQTHILDMYSKLVNDFRFEFDLDQNPSAVNVYITPFYPQYSYKIQYLIDQYIHVSSRSGIDSAVAVYKKLGKEFQAKLDTYIATKAVYQRAWIAQLRPEGLNFYNMEYLSVRKARRFQTKRDVILFFKALISSPYDFKFNGYFVTDWKDVVKIFTYNDYYLDPCTRCSAKRISKGYVASGLKKSNDLDPVVGKRLKDLKTDLELVLKSDLPDTLLPIGLEYLEQ